MITPAFALSCQGVGQLCGRFVPTFHCSALTEKAAIARIFEGLAQVYCMTPWVYTVDRFHCVITTPQIKIRENECNSGTKYTMMDNQKVCKAKYTVFGLMYL